MPDEKISVNQIKEWMKGGAIIENPKQKWMEGGAIIENQKQTEIIKALNKFIPKAYRDIFLKIQIQKNINGGISEQDFLEQIQLIRAIELQEHKTIRTLLGINPVNDDEIDQKIFESKTKELFPKVSEYLTFLADNSGLLTYTKYFPEQPPQSPVADYTITDLDLNPLQSAIVHKNANDVKNRLGKNSTVPVDEIKEALLVLVAQTHNDIDIGPIQNTLTTLVSLIKANDKQNVLNAHNSDGQTLLMLAIKQIGSNPTGYGNLAIVNFLIKNGADVNAVDNDGNTALMLAAKNGNITLLLQNKAEAEAEAAVKDKAEAEAAVKDKAEAAVKRVDVDIVKLLLDKGADAKAVAKDGTTALMLAAEKGSLEIVESLLDKAADVKAVAEDGTTALSLAVASKKLNLVTEVLKDDSATTLLNIKGKRGMTPLLIAAMDNSTEIVKRLVEAGADVNIATGSPVSNVSSNDNKVSSNDNDPVISDKYFSDTPLAIAVRNHNVEMVNALLEANPKPNLKIWDQAGNTPLILAMRIQVPKSQEQSQINIAKALIDAGSVNYPDSNGYMPLDWCQALCLKANFDPSNQIDKSLKRHKANSGNNQLTLLSRYSTIPLQLPPSTTTDESVTNRSIGTVRVAAGGKTNKRGAIPPGPTGPTGRH